MGTLQPMRRSADLSWHLHQAAMPYLRADWRRSRLVIERNLEKQRRLVRSPMAQAWIDAWARAAQEGPDAIEKIVMVRGERGDDLRQMTPLAGILPNAERWRVIREVRRATRGL